MPHLLSNLSFIEGSFTSDEDIGGVGFISRLGGDPQGVETLILLVQVRERQCGSVSAPVHLVPLRWRQQNIWKTCQRMLARLKKHQGQKWSLILHHVFRAHHIRRRFERALKCESELHHPAGSQKTNIPELSTHRLCTTGSLAGSGAGTGRWRRCSPGSWSPPLFQMKHQTYQQCESGSWRHTQTLVLLRRRQTQYSQSLDC